MIIALSRDSLNEKSVVLHVPITSICFTSFFFGGRRFSQVVHRHVQQLLVRPAALEAAAPRPKPHHAPGATPLAPLRRRCSRPFVAWPTRT